MSIYNASQEASTPAAPSAGRDNLYPKSDGFYIQDSAGTEKKLVHLENSLIPANQIPPSAIERMVVVADQTARYALTTASVQNGDTVKQADTSEFWYVIDDTNLANSAGYAVYTAGTASAVALGGVTGLGTGVATALAANVGAAGAPVVNGGVLGTPSGGATDNLTTATSAAAITDADFVDITLAAGGKRKTLWTAVVTYLAATFGSKSGKLSQFATTTSAELAGVISDETGSGPLVFATSPVLVTPALGTPISGNLANCTGLPIAFGVAGLASGVAGFLGNPTVNRAAVDWLSGLRVFGNDANALRRGKSAMYKITSIAPASAQYFLIATLPISSGSTGDSLLLDFTVGGINTKTERIRLRLGNRNGFKADTEYYSRQETAIAPMARIETYTQADGLVLVYAVFNATIFVHMTLSAIMGGFAATGTLVAPEAVVGTLTVPLGTLSYSSGTDYVNASLKNVVGVVAGQNGIGYISGQGGTVTQATSKATGVTLSKTTGAITTAADSLAPSTVVFFVLTNTFIAANDILKISHKSGGTFAAYDIQARCAAGSATIAIRNLTAGALAEALTLQFILLKGAIV